MSKISEAMRRCLKYLLTSAPAGVTLFPLGSVGTTLRMAQKCVDLGYAEKVQPTKPLGLIAYHITASGRAALEETKK